ncbi:MtrB/PioB family decaheme-associated outer membrane protein [Uliginosibacterium gangwonense]|uniref:MtrB/PioB family decaheme-associated outer membrane protein n=1 Tax=Uliginosibacterium gangwonense TaxID=392736 RepID=UPI00036C65F1|nr:MtrB/PioB family decaheme-associated outer membrane protein [Uliginosibacterium gangwonense]
MMNRQDAMKLSTLAMAVVGALFSMQAHADNDEETALKQPTNFVSLGLIATSRDSAKFGEYSGLTKQGGYLNLNFSVRGGSGYTDNANGKTLRWSISGTDLGLTSRSAQASVSDQGVWNLGVSYDELRHTTSDTYRTVYSGAMGGNQFVLPTGFGTASNTNTLTAAQQAAYHDQDIYNTRQNTAFTAGYKFSPALALNFEFNHLDQSGGKLMAFGSAAKAGSVTGEAISILPMPTYYQTETFNVALNWSGEKGHLATSYYGSFFNDRFNSVKFQTFAGGNVMQTMVTAPSNQFHQLNLDGNYAITPKTRVIGDLSYGLNTQNDAYVVDAGMMNAALPSNSLHGKVVSENANLKLTNQSIKNLTLATSFKYSLRDNRTSSDIYRFNALDTTNNAAYPNTPLSFEKILYDVSGDYRITHAQALHLAATHEGINRWCNHYATSATYPDGTNCVVATSSREDKLETSYRLQATDDIDMRVGYVYGHRRTDSDQYAKAAFSGNNSGLGAGINGGDFLGYYPFFDASRRQQQVKANANWQITEKVSLGLGGKHSYDSYDDSTYGVQNGRNWSLNLDVAYAYSDNGAVGLYVTEQRKKRDLKSVNSLATNSIWTNELEDRDFTIGMNVKHSNLLGDKLDLTADLSYVFGKTSYSTQVPYLSTCGATATYTCGDLPKINNRSMLFKLGANYKLAKQSILGMQYIHSRLSVIDYYYNALQYGYTPNALLATNQQPGSYAQNAVILTYKQEF